MYAESKENPSEEDPNYTGHKFEVYYTGCVASGCHPSTNNAMQLTAWMREEVEDTESQIVGLMQQWSLTKAPAIDPAFVKYGVNAWEYTVAGQLSNPDGVSTIVGPPSNLQSKIPSDIKQARFNLYLVEHDASYGVHNPNYARVLLEDAKNRVNRQLR
jgi:hypothetical protein